MKNLNNYIEVVKYKNKENK